MTLIESSNPNKLGSDNIILVGLMGSGKTTIGKELAKRTNKTFMDSDHEIERATGVTIDHIFDIEGEEGFRRREEKMIQTLVLKKNIVLATGGGAILNKDSRELLIKNGVVVYLESTVDELLSRVSRSHHRPLLKQGNVREKLEELLIARAPLYEKMADIRFHYEMKGDWEELFQTLIHQIQTFAAPNTGQSFKEKKTL